MSFRKAREQRSQRAPEVWPDDEADPKVYFGSGERSVRDDRKARQLCKQVERAVGLTLGSVCEGEALLGAAVLAVEPAPDSSRLRVTVALTCSQREGAAAEARAELDRWAPAFREEVARSIHRKRVPTLVFDIRLSEGFES